MKLAFEFVDFVWWWLGTHYEYVIPIVVFVLVYTVGTYLVQSPQLSKFLLMKVTDMNVIQLFLVLVVVGAITRR